MILEQLPPNAGPCRKQTVTATIVAPDGQQFSATNWTACPQARCPREGMATGAGYELCRDVCKQPGHAEINAVKLAGDKARGGVMFIEGHTYACEPCIEAAKKAGIVEIRFEAPAGARR